MDWQPIETTSKDFNGWCATSMCRRPAQWRFESGGVGSIYCSACKEKISKLPPPPTEKE